MIYNTEMRQMAAYTLERFRAEGLTIATAESCTGGLISALLTAIPGSSDVLERGFVTYSNQAKTDSLGVPEDLLREHGAVSAETAMAMAFGCLNNSRADVTVAVTGIAGPGGGSEAKPVGLVFIAVATRAGEQVFLEELHLGDMGRDELREETVRIALEMLLSFGLPDRDDGYGDAEEGDGDDDSGGPDGSPESGSIH